WSLLVYLVFRLGDMAIRGQFTHAFSGRLGALFAIEIILGGIVPVALLASESRRNNPQILFWGELLAALGIIFNRMNAILFAMNLKGPMPQSAPATYFPTIFEWGISVGLIAATIFLFGLAARLVPLLPRQEAGQGRLS
ncbi:MAG TPA: 4Fe-4S ferredoxin, partial [Candidatus Angelobacter sp.]